MSKSPLFLLAAILLFLQLSGCAVKQWQDPLNEKDDKAARALIHKEQQRRESCTCCIDAEIAIQWNSTLYEGGLNGYLQVLQPSSIKLVAINPLGQPLYAITTDGYTFQAINVVKGIYKHGKVSSFVDKHSLPEHILHQEWANWLTADMNFTEEQLVELRQDISSRGIWLNIEKGQKNKFLREYMLFDPLERKIVERVAIDKDGDEIARITYKGWTMADGCPLPTDIVIFGVSYGTDILIKLGDILNDQEFTKANFNLKLPPNYQQQYYP